MRQYGTNHWHLCWRTASPQSPAPVLLLEEGRAHFRPLRATHCPQAASTQPLGLSVTLKNRNSFSTTKGCHAWASHRVIFPCMKCWKQCTRTARWKLRQDEQNVTAAHGAALVGTRMGWQEMGCHLQAQSSTRKAPDPAGNAKPSNSCYHLFEDQPARTTEVTNKGSRPTLGHWFPHQPCQAGSWFVIALFFGGHLSTCWAEAMCSQGTQHSRQPAAAPGSQQPSRAHTLQALESSGKNADFGKLTLLCFVPVGSRSRSAFQCCSAPPAAAMETRSSTHSPRAGGSGVGLFQPQFWKRCKRATRVLNQHLQSLAEPLYHKGKRS